MQRNKEDYDHEGYRVLHKQREKRKYASNFSQIMHSPCRTKSVKSFHGSSKDRAKEKEREKKEKFVLFFDEVKEERGKDYSEHQ